MRSTPSLRRMWVMFKQLLAEEELDKRELVLAQTAFYTGARGILRIMGHLLERGDYDELHELVRKHGRQIDKMLARLPPPAPKH